MTTKTSQETHTLPSEISQKTTWAKLYPREVLRLPTLSPLPINHRQKFQLLQLAPLSWKKVMDLVERLFHWTSQNQNHLPKSQLLELSTEELSRSVNSDSSTIEVTCQLPSSTDHKIKSHGRSIFNSWIIIITYPSSLRELGRKWTHTDSLLSKVCSICWKRVEPRSSQLFHNLSFQLKLPWTPETQKSLPSLSRSCKLLSPALIPSVRHWCHTTDRSSQSWTYSRPRTWTSEIRSTTARERCATRVTWSKEPWSFSKCTEEKMLSSTLSTWSQPTNLASSTESEFLKWNEWTTVLMKLKDLDGDNNYKRKWYINSNLNVICSFL